MNDRARVRSGVFVQLRKIYGPGGRLESAPGRRSRETLQGNAPGEPLANVPGERLEAWRPGSLDKKEGRSP